MIIRTTMAERAVTGHKVTAPRLSDREKRRLENTRHSEGKVSPAAPTKIVDPKPVEEEVRVEEKIVETIKNEEPAVSAQPIEEPVKPVAKPGTAVIRSKVLDELANSYKAEPDEQPKKKYKIISIQKD